MRLALPDVGMAVAAASASAASSTAGPHRLVRVMQGAGTPSREGHLVWLGPRSADRLEPRHPPQYDFCAPVSRGCGGMRSWCERAHSLWWLARHRVDEIEAREIQQSAMIVESSGGLSLLSSNRSGGGALVWETNYAAATNRGPNPRSDAHSHTATGGEFDRRTPGWQPRRTRGALQCRRLRAPPVVDLSLRTR